MVEGAVERVDVEDHEGRVQSVGTLDQLDVALGDRDPGLLAEGDPARRHGPALLEDVDVSLGDVELALGLVGDPVGGDLEGLGHARAFFRERGTSDAADQDPEDCGNDDRPRQGAPDDCGGPYLRAGVAAKSDRGRAQAGAVKRVSADPSAAQSGTTISSPVTRTSF